MLRTIIEQTYTGNLAVDTSGFFNQGLPIQVTPSLLGFAFDQPGSRINIKLRRRSACWAASIWR